MGGTPVIWPGGTVATLTGTTEITFTAAHNLSAGQAVTFNGEMRFVTAILNSTTVFINASFTTLPVNGSAMGPTINYGLATSLPSASIFDYWDPSTAVQRIVDWFCDGSVEELLVGMVDTAVLDPAQLRALAGKIAKAKAKGETK